MHEAPDERTDAVKFLVQSILEADGPRHLLLTGGHTNIGMALREAPALTERLEGIALMGYDFKSFSGAFSLDSDIDAADDLHPRTYATMGQACPTTSASPDPRLPAAALRSADGDDANAPGIVSVETHQQRLAIPACKIHDQIASVTDILPTVLEVAGVQAPTEHEVDGFPLQTSLTGAADDRHPAQFLMHYPHGPHRSNYFT